MCQAFDGERKFLMAMDDHPKYEAGEGEDWRSGFWATESETPVCEPRT